MRIASVGTKERRSGASVAVDAVTASRAQIASEPSASPKKEMRWRRTEPGTLGSSLVKEGLLIIGGVVRGGGLDATPLLVGGVVQGGLNLGAVARVMAATKKPPKPRP